MNEVVTIAHRRPGHPGDPPPARRNSPGRAGHQYPSIRRKDRNKLAQADTAPSDGTISVHMQLTVHPDRHQHVAIEAQHPQALSDLLRLTAGFVEQVVGTDADTFVQQWAAHDGSPLPPAPGVQRRTETTTGAAPGPAEQPKHTGRPSQAASTPPATEQGGS